MINPKKILKNDNGSTLILTMGAIVMLLVIAYVISVYLIAYAHIRDVRDNTQLALDRYTIQTGKVIMVSIKNGNDYTEVLDADKFWTNFQEENKLDSGYTASGANGEEIFKIVDRDLKFLESENRLKTVANYTVRYNYYFFGIKIFDADVHLKAESLYNLKF